MWRLVVRKRLLLSVAVLCLVGMAACSSDDDLDGGPAFRNLGKRGDSDVTAGHASAALK